ncbi:MAG: hypothetical protein BV457_03420 [Thermoplasmata archaeon M9B1D]|nr:MAG: hypothetical protein BV457_03420 [Thermoplasmata archaeon M9B1D]
MNYGKEEKGLNNMDGVNVLNIIVSYTHNELWTIIGWVFWIFVVVSFYISLANYGKNFRFMISIICFVFFSIGVIFCIIKYDDSATPYNKYQVTIDNNVSINDLTDKYDIIRIDGEIYTIIEKGDK